MLKTLETFPKITIKHTLKPLIQTPSNTLKIQTFEIMLQH